MDTFENNVTPMPGLLKSELAAAVTQGRIAAIKMYRARTAAGLREAKAQVDAELVEFGFAEQTKKPCDQCNGTGLVSSNFRMLYHKDSWACDPDSRENDRR